MVSIIIPSFNYAHFLNEAIESVIRQTYSDWEVVVIDDASQDNTSELIKRYEGERVRYFKNPENLGLDRTVKRGINESRGEYVCLCSADDWLPQRSLELRISSLIKDGAEAIHGGLTRVEDQKKTYIMPVDTRLLDDYVNFLKGIRGINQGINNATFLWKKKSLEKVFVGLKSEPYNHNDYELALRTINALKTTVVMNNTYYYRVHKGSLLSQMKRKKGWVEARTRLERNCLPH